MMSISPEGIVFDGSDNFARCLSESADSENRRTAPDGRGVVRQISNLLH